MIIDEHFFEGIWVFLEFQQYRKEMIELFLKTKKEWIKKNSQEEYENLCSFFLSKDKDNVELALTIFGISTIKDSDSEMNSLKEWMILFEYSLTFSLYQKKRSEIENHFPFLNFYSFKLNGGNDFSLCYEFRSKKTYYFIWGIFTTESYHILDVVKNGLTLLVCPSIGNSLQPVFEMSEEEFDDTQKEFSEMLNLGYFDKIDLSPTLKKIFKFCKNLKNESDIY